ncbi:LysM peptidoglycan-binding domain-containing protein [Desulfobacterota bacterium AH_259_B03_O07]|nr:LysM peptidoglycan-binding domain-containing protein [Desulfobacterota bacterium AH_259_B03_O07]
MKKDKSLIYLIGAVVLIFVLIETLSAPAQQSQPEEDIEYIVVKGDTLWGISKRFGVTVNDLYEANGLTSDLILVGQKLKIPSKAVVPAYEEPPVEPEKPTVTIEEPTVPEKKPPVTIEKPSVPEEKPPVTVKEIPVSPDTLAFKWAFVARIDPDGRNKVVNIAKKDLTEKTGKFTVSAGDKIAFFVEPAEHTYVYIYLVDSRKNLELVFPTSMDIAILESEFIPGKGTYIPAKYEWFVFDENKGTEVFYLIASPNRLDRLEELTRNYINADENPEFAKKKVLDEIRGTKKRVAFSTRLERPIAFGGRIRGLEIDIAKLAVQIEADNLYSKTIRIRNGG